MLRAVLLCVVTAMCAACASESATKVMGYQSTGRPQGLAQTDAASMTAGAPNDTLSTPIRRTMADKVLAAIALERVTGRKPDPARLAEAW